MTGCTPPVVSFIEHMQRSHVAIGAMKPEDHVFDRLPEALPRSNAITAPKHHSLVTTTTRVLTNTTRTTTTVHTTTKVTVTTTTRETPAGIETTTHVETTTTTTTTVDTVTKSSGTVIETRTMA